MQVWDNCSFLFICYLPSHETRDHFVSLYPVEPGGAHTVVNWSFSIWQNNQGGLARLLPPGFPVTGLPAPSRAEAHSPMPSFCLGIPCLDPFL